MGRKIVEILLTSDEFREAVSLTEARPNYLGIYYTKQVPCLMYQLGDIIVAVRPRIAEANEGTPKLLDYKQMNRPRWKDSTPDPVKHASKRKS